MTGFSDIDGVVSGDQGIAHFGDVFREQRRLAAGAALVPLDDRTVIEVAGPERLGWLDSIPSQALGRLAAGDSTELLVLDPQGRVEHAAGVVDDGSSTWLIADAGDADALATWLQRMKFRTQATIEVRPDLALLGFVDGGAASERARAAASAPAGAPIVWSDPWQRVSADISTPRSPSTRVQSSHGGSPSSRAERRTLSRQRCRQKTSRAFSRQRRCASPPGAHAGRPRSTSARCRTSPTGSARPCI